MLRISLSTKATQPALKVPGCPVLPHRPATLCCPGVSSRGVPPVQSRQAGGRTASGVLTAKAVARGSWGDGQELRPSWAGFHLFLMGWPGPVRCVSCPEPPAIRGKDDTSQNCRQDAVSSAIHVCGTKHLIPFLGFRMHALASYSWASLVVQWI